MSNFLSNTPGDLGNTVGIGSLDSTRRLFNFGERVAELAPEQTPFFVYLSKVAKKATDDPTFKFLEQRHQWQRRNFITGEVTTTAASGGNGLPNTEILVSSLYNKYGNVVGTTISDSVAPSWILTGQVLAIKGSYDAAGDDDFSDAVHVIAKVRVESMGTATSTYAKPTVKFLSMDKADGSGEQTVVDNAKFNNGLYPSSPAISLTDIPALNQPIVAPILPVI